VQSTPEPHWWSWADIVRHADRLGIPNFQRGAVWDTGNRVALLESIYEQSPCGSFVLWAPTPDSEDPRRHGVPLRVLREDAAPMWLVDGQQRTRAMLDTFQQLVDQPIEPSGWSLVRPADQAALEALGAPLRGAGASAESEEAVEADAEGEPYPWLVVLPAMPVFDRGSAPYFGRHSESRNVRRGSMFRRFRPRARRRFNADGKVRNVPPLPVGTVPLASLLAAGGIFHADGLRVRARQAVASILGDAPLLDVLDDLLPWGPQFLTGHAFEMPAQGAAAAEVMRWAHIHARREETGIQAMVGRLRGLFEEQWRPVFTRFAGMLDGNRFAVGWLPPSDVSAAIDAYVRINRAGIRVRAEERALAMLSRARPALLDDLAAFTRLRDGGDAVEDQRALLAHESDRQMGFAVWMTAVTRYANLALLGDYGRRWLGVSAIDKDTFSYRLDRIGPQETKTGKQTWARTFSSPEDLIEECAARATPALALIDAVLCDHLYFDHRMARPSARALLPMIDLFYRVPAHHILRLREDAGFRSAVSRLLHWTLLSPYIDQPDLERFIVEVHGIDEDEARKKSRPVPCWEGDTETIDTELQRAFGRYQRSLLRIWHRKHLMLMEGRKRTPVAVAGLAVSDALTKLSLDAFQLEVTDARSLQHPAVGWLYAIERRGGAAEFSWEAQVAGFASSNKKHGVPTRPSDAERALQRWPEADLYPEKQHIVPFTIARQVVDKGGTRATASPSNALGNLTWLSQRQNGLDALADRWTVMDEGWDHDNLAARGLLAETEVDGMVRRVLDVYRELRGLVQAEDWKDRQATAQSLFAAFCEGRARWVVDQMRHWLDDDLGPDAARWLSEADAVG
jgi:hypothetical protein